MVDVDHKALKWHCQTSNKRCTKFQNLTASHVILQLVFDQSIETMCYVKNDDVVGAVPTGDAPTTAEW